ncbi:hypothetical protein [Pedobacter hiemivivus]|uniref:DUF4595 domain-containing protein n=1 Tax=Pedobacter hiemivivus TaxID=2530454 RepID=A0A4R0N8G6_9SPHI|nr:hypothetical protein [Pedobacter hiemivivus]TCC96449.1 hypothetical protein EZ444_10725 [Pedobacter hiemivivus]
MSNLKHYHFSALFALLLVLACKKNQNTKIEIIAPEPPAVIKKFIPIKLEGSGLIINLKYMENTTLLTEISEAAGVKALIIYDADQYPSILEKYQRDKLIYKTYYRKEDKKTINKMLMFDYNDLQHNFSPIGFYTLSYNNLQQVSTINYYNKSDQLTDTHIQSYTTSGNLSTVNATNNLGSTNVHTYIFDQKNGIASNIRYTQLLAFEFEHWFLSYCINNLLNYRNQKFPLENVDFSYEYNADGYPSKMIITKNKSIQSIKITYKSIEL